MVLLMPPIYFYSDNNFFLQAIKSLYLSQSQSITISHITTKKELETQIDSLTSSCSENIHLFSFSSFDITDTLLFRDRKKEMCFIIVIDTPISKKCLKTGRWTIISRYSDIREFVLVVSNCHVAERRYNVNLSAREHEVLDLLLKGMTYLSIASKLKISRKTVYTHTNGLFLKTGFMRSNHIVYLRYGKIFS